MIGRGFRFRLLPVAMLLLVVLAVPVGSAPSRSRMSSVKTVFLVLFENTDWSSITPSVAPYIRKTVIRLGAHATQYFNPRGNHPSEPNYIWLEAGHHLGLTTDNDASASNSTNTADHLVRYLENAGISWKTYQEDIDGTSCPLTSEALTVPVPASDPPLRRTVPPVAVRVPARTVAPAVWV